MDEAPVGNLSPARKVFLKVPKRIWATLSFVFVGVLLIVLAYYAEPSTGRLSIKSLVALEIGIAFVIAGIAEFILLEHASADMSRVTEKMLADVRKDFTIVTQTFNQGLTDVMPPRRVDDSTRGLLGQVMARTRGTIRILGVSLGDFLDGGQPLNRVLQELMNNDEAVEIRMLLMDPFHSSALMRSKAEQGPNTSFGDSYLYANMQTSIASLRDFKRRSAGKKNFKIGARFFNIHPPYYMLATRETLFMEPYHLGHLANDGPCIGGYVPTLRFSESSRMYRRSQRHFDYIWCSAIGQDCPDAKEYEWFDGEYLVVRTLEEVVKDVEAKQEPKNE